MRSVWILLVAGGCRGILGIEQPIDLAPGDAPSLPPPDAAPPGCAAWHPRAFDPCALGPPLPAITLPAGAYTYDTTAAGGKLTDATGKIVLASTVTLDQPGGPTVAVLSIERLAIEAGAAIDVVGFKPLLVASWSTIAIDGAIDAGSHLGVTDAAAHIAQTVQFGAGANAGCADRFGQDGGDAPHLGSGGGGGGGGRDAGGDAASGGSTVGGVATPGGLGGAAAAALPGVMVGGCGGGRSGTAGSSATPPAAAASQALGGGGGGSIRLVARVSIALAGTISANGAGGAGGPLHSACGGGGGGAGGEIELEAPDVTIDGTLGANGGGAGGGASAQQPGNDGADGAIGGAAAAGGAGVDSDCGSAGGAGSSQTELAGSAGGPAGMCGGGGGGGGAGYVIFTSGHAVTGAQALISPPPTMRP